MNLIQSLCDEIGFTLPKYYNASRLLWDNLADNPDRIAVLHDQGTLTYRELAAEASRVGNYLQSLGCKAGDRVIFLMDDEPGYPAGIMGAMRAGLVPVLINTLSTKDLISYFIEDSASKAIIHSSVFADLIPDNYQDGRDGVAIVNAADRPWSQSSSHLEEHPTLREDMAFWMYSSGSTGNPKGIVHIHEDAAYTADTYAHHILNINENDVCFSVPKIYFAYGFGNSITFPMRVGAASVLMSGRPNPKSIFTQIKKFHPTIFFGLPTLYTALAQHPSIETADLSSLRLCISAAEVLSEDIANAWKAKCGLDIVEGLGSTEMLHIYLSNSEQERKVSSAGKVVPGYAVRLVDANGNPASAGDSGVMEVCGLSGTKSYWNQPEKTADTIRDGWINTGDRFLVDEDDYYFFLGRADDLVKVSGQWVYPLEVELALNEHEAVLESCVLAVELPDKRMTIKAWITPAKGHNPDSTLAEELKAYSKSVLLPHKYPREIKFVDALPKTGTDKIDRQSLLMSDTNP